MKRNILFLIFFNITIWGFAQPDVISNKYVFEYGMNINEVYKVLGTPQCEKLVTETVNQDSDIMMCTYNGINIYYLRQSLMVIGYYITSDSYVLKIQDYEIKCGNAKHDIEKLIGECDYIYTDNNGHSVYTTSFENFTSIFLSYDSKGILTSIQYEHD